MREHVKWQPQYAFIILTILLLVMTYVVYRYWDSSLALFVHREYPIIKKTWLNRTVILSNWLIAASGIYLVVFFIYWLIVGVVYTLPRKLFYIANVVALSYALNIVLKHVFGRITIYSFIAKQSSGFNWLEGGPNTGFPSTHTSIVVGGMCAIAIVFPKIKYLAYLVALIVALSIFTMGSHFLSDIIAGTLEGILLAYSLRAVILGNHHEASTRC